MLVWINGPFGGGKTSTAHELARRVAGAVVCDPEAVGFGLTRAMPRAAWPEDFQELPAWRTGVVEVLDRALRAVDGPVVVPMTVVDDGYVEELHGGLRRLGHDVRHLALLSAPEEIRRRLYWRGLPGLRRDRWALDRVEPYLAALARDGFAEQVDTTGLSVPEVADVVAARVGLPISPDTDGPARAWVRRTGVSLRHIRPG